MVFNAMQLTVLRKLKTDGPLKSGIHPSVSSLVRAGFVSDSEEGYSLNESGKLALLANDELSTVHREILMRIHSASARMEQYNEDAFKTEGEKDCLGDLLLLELVTIDNWGNVSLTDDGRILWDVALNAYHMRDETRLEKGGFNKANERQRLKKQEREQAAARMAIDASPVREEQIIRSDEDKPLVTPPNTEDCEHCIHAEVLELISKKYPKVAELRDTLLKQKQLLKELGL